MRTIFPSLLLLSLIGLLYAGIVDDGRPSCDTEEEIEIAFFRNTFDATAYWVCYDLHKPGTLQRCPNSMAFLDSIKSCVGWDDWSWKNPVERRR